jgi:hypothetical protein
MEKVEEHFHVDGAVVVYFLYQHYEILIKVNIVLNSNFGKVNFDLIYF